MELTDHVSTVPLIGPSYARRLEKLGIKTVRDLLYHLPFRYDDYSKITKISAVGEGETVTIVGKVLDIKNLFTKRGFVLQKAKILDDTGVIEALWFNQRFLTSAIHKDDQISLSGKIKSRHLEAPDYEIIRGETIHTGRLVPVYPETAGISSKWLRSRINFMLNNVQLTDYLPNQTIDLNSAIHQVHFPKDLQTAQLAHDRLAFDELLFSQLQSKIRRDAWQEKTVGHKFKIVEIRSDLKKFVDNLPFKLTASQKTIIDEIYQDLACDVPMNRLLQGDVGSGKTVVAALAMLAAKLNGYQAALMAPTEILANQHYETLNKMGLNVGLVTSSTKNYSNYDLIVGTHALLNIDFKKLGLVVIDEQHRFGVEQRAKLTAKGKNPHVLTMTATPIPRTIALTLYGDLDVSVLTDMPIGRVPIKTWVVPDHKRQDAYQWLKKYQAFIICPLIDESETLLTVKSAKAEFTRLQTEVFPDLKLGLIHGRMKPTEKDTVLADFKTQKINILVATPVVEVGIDIPTATVMVIEEANRFGLAQLHQLRGRVGRGDAQSYCLLFAPAGFDRLKHLETIGNGLQLAEIDLKFRGPGERFGTSQHGRWELKIADFSNLELVERSNILAQQILANPSQFPLLHQLLRQSKISYDSLT